MIFIPTDFSNLDLRIIFLAPLKYIFEIFQFPPDKNVPTVTVFVYQYQMILCVINAVPLFPILHMKQRTRTAGFLHPRANTRGIASVDSRRGKSRMIRPDMIYPSAIKSGNPRDAAPRHAASRDGIGRVPYPVCQQAGRAADGD